MKRLIFSLLAICATAGAAGAGVVYTSDVNRSTPRVQIYTPTPNTPNKDKAATSKPKVIYKTRTIFRPVYIRVYQSRAERRKRAIGHRYTGFIKQYRGDKYPF